MNKLKFTESDFMNKTKKFLAHLRYKLDALIKKEIYNARNV